MCTTCVRSSQEARSSRVPTTVQTKVAIIAFVVCFCRVAIDTTGNIVAGKAVPVPGTLVALE